MEAVAEGLWELADHHEKKGEMGKAVKCLEAICQSQVSFLPIVEVRTRLRIAALLLKHSHNLDHAKSHLERAVCNSSPFNLVPASACFKFSSSFVNALKFIKISYAALLSF